MPKTLIIGVGNILLKDEGVGVHVASALQQMELPKDVEVQEAGTATIDLLNVISEVDKLVVIDAVKGRDKPGTIYKFRPEDVDIENDIITSLHQISLFEVLEMASRIRKSPISTVIIGIEPKEIDWGLELSNELKEKLPDIIRLVRDEIYS